MKFTVAATTAFALAAATAVLAETALEPKYCNHRDTSCCPKGTKCWIVNDTGVPLVSAPSDTSVDSPESSAISAADAHFIPTGVKVCHGREAEKCCPSPPQLCAILATDGVTVEAVGTFRSKSSQGVTVAEAAPKTEVNTPSSNIILKRGACLNGCPFWCMFVPRCFMAGLTNTPPRPPKRARAAFDTTPANFADPILARNNAVPPKCTWACNISGTSCFCPSYCAGRYDMPREKELFVSRLEGAPTSQPSDLSATTTVAMLPRDVTETLPTMDAVTTHDPPKKFNCPAVCRPGKGCICPSQCPNCYTPHGRPTKSPKTTDSHSFGREWKPCVTTFYEEANQQVGPTATRYKKSVIKTTTVDCKGCAATTKFVVFSAPTPTTTVKKHKTTSTVTVCADNTEGMKCGVDIVC